MFNGFKMIFFYPLEKDALPSILTASPAIVVGEKLLSIVFMLEVELFQAHKNSV
ncbi:hypothetical protein D777_02985 [Marinobacter nitratireducens]|uniref:Uncharacterized protein n=1 Tax=Marinobacter nitratireducens TaxID=1137280 RepID=A0A072MZK3_9GAMM|nr:hypothetical protein D777_02985 [Marinobacter nitratireducens]